jgi:Glycosyl transferase family 2
MPFLAGGCGCAPSLAARVPDSYADRMRVAAPLARVVGGFARRVARAIGWALVIPLLRARARRRVARLRPGVATVVTVNWNSWSYLETMLQIVRRRSPPGTEILVVDNGSKKARALRPRGIPGVKTVLLPMNLGHDFALDVGALICGTEFVVALDVDAFPISGDWLQQLEGALEGAEVAGARLNREYVHPCCWAMRTERFVARGHSFCANYRPREHGRDASGEVGEEISANEAPDLVFFEVTTQRGPGDVGTVFGDLVYHNFYATRFGGTDEPTLDGVVGREDPDRAWEEALRRYGGSELDHG